MPHANIWIRKENEEKWEAIADKSTWINTLLANSDDTSNYGADTGKGVTVLSETVPLNKIKALVNGRCKIHGIALDSRGKCLQKGCKFA